MTGTFSPAGLDRLHAAMAARVERRELPGLLTVLAQADEIAVDAIGNRAFDSPDPVQRDTPFRIASLTKPILAVATLMLVEDGKLSLDEPVDRLLPELANRRVLRRIDGPLDDTVPATRPITVDDLLTCRMGYGMLLEPSFDPPFPIVNAANELQLALGAPDPRTPHTPDEWIARFGTLPLMSQPGEKWHYNASFAVLGVLAARAAGQSLGDLMQARIFEPLGMRTTGFSLPIEVTQQLPSHYMQAGTTQALPLSTPDEWSRPPAFPSGAGGLLSSADDFLAFARLLLDGGRHGNVRLLTERSVELMTTNHLTPEQIADGVRLLSGSGWGYGVAVTVAADAVSPPGRYGWSGGYGTSWFNDPGHARSAIILTQTAGILWNGTLDEFARLAASA